MPLRLASIALLLLLCCSQSARAARFEVQYLDPPGEGVNDSAPPDPASSAGGNERSSLGEQRRAVIAMATTIWGSLLDTELPIQLAIRLEPLACSGDGLAQLGSAGTAALFANFEGAPLADTWYPVALANQLYGSDLAPDAPDIDAVFNSALDDGACLDGQRWYYGLDGNPPEGSPDFLSVVLHELAHGLGFSTALDLYTGQGPEGYPDVFSHQLFDRNYGETWDRLTAEERAQSARSPRQVVWRGTEVRQLASTLLAQGSPTPNVSPEVAGFSGLINEVTFTPTLDTTLAAPLVVPTPATACETIEPVNGAIVLVSAGSCSLTTQLQVLERAGASAALIDAVSNTVPPGDVPTPQDVSAAALPALVLSSTDAALLRLALDTEVLTVTLERTPHLTGTDAEGRPFLNTTSPYQPGSSVVHWDPLLRRRSPTPSGSLDLLMEPFSQVYGPEVDLTAAALIDLGWKRGQCGDGQLQEAEQCDPPGALCPAGCGISVESISSSSDAGMPRDAALLASPEDAADETEPDSASRDAAGLGRASADAGTPQDRTMSAPPDAGSMGNLKWDSGNLAPPWLDAGDASAATVDSTVPALTEERCGCWVVGGGGGSQSDWSALLAALGLCLLRRLERPKPNGTGEHG